MSRRFMVRVLRTKSPSGDWRRRGGNEAGRRRECGGIVATRPGEDRPARIGSMANVAIVDDEANIRETVAFALQREGHQVKTFADGSEAWAAFQNSLPDVAVLDILMPRLDGLELCRRLRALSETLPIIFVTSKDDELDRILGPELAPDDYLCKPFWVRELVARIRVLLRRAGHGAESPEASESARA